MTVTKPDLDLDDVWLAKGGHDEFDPKNNCLMEVAAAFAGREHTDAPPCVSPILGAFGRNLNDVLPDDKRQQLKPFIPRLPGTAGDGRDQMRGLMAADWLIRVYTPTWLRLAGLEAEAVSLETLPRQASWDDVEAAVPVVRLAKERAYAARAAAGDAAWAAAGSAAWAAAGSAARAAAWAAAGAAAGSAARDAAWSAAWAAAGDKLQPTVAALQDSAVELFDRLITADAA